MVNEIDDLFKTDIVQDDMKTPLEQARQNPESMK